MKDAFKIVGWLIFGVSLVLFAGYTVGTAPFKLKCYDFANTYGYDDWKLIGGTCHYKKNGEWKNEYQWERESK